MAQSTPGFGLPIIEPAIDRIKSADQVSALASDINRLSTKADSALSRVNERAWAGNATAANAKAEAAAASAKNLLQDLLLQQNDLRLRTLEALTSLDPGTVSDGTIASSVANVQSLTHEALESSFVKRGTVVHDVLDYGAKNDNITDDSAAFNAAIAAAKASGGRAYAYGMFRLEQPIIVDSHADFNNAVVNYYGAGIAFTVSGWRLKVSMPSIFNGLKSHGGGWDHVAGSVGVRMLNTNGCDIEVKFVQGFEQGLSVYGLNGGSAYNTVYLGWLFNNKIGQICDTYSSTGVGYSNQNTFIGGRISMHAAEMEGYPEGTKGVPGTKALYTTGDGDGGPNSNVWLNTCLEGATQEYAFDIDRGRNNKLINVRMEFGNAYRFGTTARDNEVTVGYVDERLTAVRDDVSGFGNDVRYQRHQDLYDKQLDYYQVNNEFPWFKVSTGQKSLYLGNGAAEPVRLRGGTGYLEVGGHLRPETAGNRDFGTPDTPWQGGYFSSRVTVGLGVDYHAAASQAPASPGLLRMYALINESGKMELRARFPDGNYAVIATQP